MPEFATERDMFELMAQKLAASVISDILDVLGFRDQVMRATIRPLYPEALVVGRAMPVLYAEVFEVPEKPYQMDMEVVDSLKPDDVLVAYAPATAKAALWGGLTLHRSQGPWGPWSRHRGHDPRCEADHGDDISCVRDWHFPARLQRPPARLCLSLRDRMRRGSGRAWRYHLWAILTGWW